MLRYYTVKLCIALQNPGFTGFLAEGLEKPDCDVIFSSGIINLSFDGLTYNTCRHFARCFYFPRSFGARENATQLAENIRAYYMLNRRIRCIYLALAMPS